MECKKTHHLPPLLPNLFTVTENKLLSLLTPEGSGLLYSQNNKGLGESVHNQCQLSEQRKGFWGQGEFVIGGTEWVVQSFRLSLVHMGPVNFLGPSSGVFHQLNNVYS